MKVAILYVFLFAPSPFTGCAGDDESLTETVTAQRDVLEEPLKSSNVEVVPINQAQLDKLIHDCQGKVVFVDFWANWCVPCKEQFPHTIEMYEKYHAQGLEVFSVCIANANDPDQVSQAETFLNSLHVPFANFVSDLDGGEKSFIDFDIDTVPQYRIYNRAGTIVKDDNQAEGIEKLVEQWLNESPG